MKKLMLLGLLLCAQVSLADAGITLAVDSGSKSLPALGESVLPVTPVTPTVVATDAGVVGSADAGTKLVEGDTVDIGGIMTKAREAGHSKSWTILFSIVSGIVVLTWGARKFGGQFVPFLKTDRGGAITVLVLGLSGSVLNTLASGAGLTLDSLLEGVVLTVMSAGGFNVVKKLIFPEDATPAAAPAPGVAPKP